MTPEHLSLPQIQSHSPLCCIITFILGVITCSGSLQHHRAAGDRFFPHVVLRDADVRGFFRNRPRPHAASCQRLWISASSQPPHVAELSLGAGLGIFLHFKAVTSIPVVVRLSPRRKFSSARVSTHVGG